MRSLIFSTLSVALVMSMVGCAANAPTGPVDLTCDLLAPNCADGKVCNPLTGGGAQCVSPLVIRGVVLDATDESPIAGALVQAVDVNGAAVGTSATTAEDGTYELTVPALRDEDGKPIEGVYTLRSQAHTFQPFPTAIRPALPIDSTTSTGGDTAGDDPQTPTDWAIESPLTTVKLLPLPGDTSDLGSIAGTIEAEFNTGILVVAEGTGAGLTGFSDSEGMYTIFNVPPGTYTVQGYAAGVQLEANTTAVSAAEILTSVDLVSADRPLSTVSGSVQIVNAGGGSITSVVLALESTFVESAARGEVPPGLRVGNVAGAFSITDVPDGKYVILAAFENDKLVRDPDQTIGGTQIVRIETPDPDMGNDLTISEGFKVTGALAVTSPGTDGPELVTSATPTFIWEDDSSEDGYEIKVFDAFGTLVWEDEIGPISGEVTVAHTYAGPPLEPGMFYQFRATSFREKNGLRTAISATEDLMGVFQLEPIVAVDVPAKQRLAATTARPG